MRRLALLASAAVVAVAATASSAKAPLSLVLEPTRADAGDIVTVRLTGTPAAFTIADRKKPFQPAIRVYLVPRAVAGEVSSRFDRRLHFVGSIVPDRNTRGLLSFRVPPLDSGAYAVAAWCPACARRGSGRGFFVQMVPRASKTLLRVRLPSAGRCPVTGEGRYGNGLLSVWLPPDGRLSTQVENDGLFQKLGWLPRRQVEETLTVRGERLDAASPPMKVLGVFWGYSYVDGVRQRGSWASAVKFPSAGCWRITGRVHDVTLSYVVNVVAGP
jgi:hypothetical protein